MTASVSRLHQGRSWRPWTGSTWPTTRWSTSPRTTGAVWRRRTAAGSWAAGTGVTKVTRAWVGVGPVQRWGGTSLALCLRARSLASSLTLESQHLCNAQSPKLQNLSASKRFNLWSLPLFVTPGTVAHQGSSVHVILQAGTLEWVAIPSSRELVMDREAWHAVIHGVAKSWIQLSN